MNCLCSLARADRFSPGVNSGGVAWERWKSMTIANGCSERVRKTGRLTRSRSSAISVHSSLQGTPQAIRAWLTSLPPVSHARISPSPASVRAGWEREICGQNLFASSESSGRDSSFSRMCRGLSMMRLSRAFSGAYSRSGTMLAGIVSRLPTRARSISGRGCGSYAPTLRATDGAKGGPNQQYRNGMPLLPALHILPTLTRGDATGVTNATCNRTGKRGHKGGSGKPHHSGTTLTDAVRLQLPTLTRRDHKSTRASEATHARNSRPLSEVIGLTDNGAMLNPEWCEWFMGWPIGWTSLDRTPETTARDISQEPDDIPRTVGRGYPRRITRIHALGNGWVPQCASLAWRLLTGVRDE